MLSWTNPSLSRSQWPRSLRYRCADARLLVLRVRIPPWGAWMSVCCVVFFQVVDSGRADPSSRGVLPIVCVWVWSWSLDSGDAYSHYGCGAVNKNASCNYRQHCFHGHSRLVLLTQCSSYLNRSTCSVRSRETNYPDIFSFPLEIFWQNYSFTSHTDYS
jgi:hypothetical protein